MVRLYEHATHGIYDLLWRRHETKGERSSGRGDARTPPIYRNPDARTILATDRCVGGVNVRKGKVPVPRGETPAASRRLGRYVSAVRRILRPVAALITLILFQFVPLESGYSCATPTNGKGGVASMADMQMPGGADAPSGAPARGDEHVPCRLPWSTSGCQTMATCALTALTTISSVVAPPDRAAVPMQQFVPLAPLSLSRAPDVPPPRA